MDTKDSKHNGAVTPQYIHAPDGETYFRLMRKIAQRGANERFMPPLVSETDGGAVLDVEHG